MRRRIATIVLMIATVAGGVFIASGLFAAGSGGGWSHEAGDAWSAEKVLQNFFDEGRPNLTVVVRAAAGTADDPEVDKAAAEIATRLGELAVFEIESYWSLGRPAFMKSEDGTAALMFGRIPGPSATLADRADVLSRRLQWDRDVVTVSLGGTAMTHLDAREASSGALIPVLLAALVGLGIVAVRIRSIGSVALMGAGMLVAGSASVIALEGLQILTEVPALSKVIGLALALGITAASSYLLIVRFAEERAAGAGRQAAVFATVTTAGRVVAVMAAVAVALGFTLIALPTALLRSTGFAIALTALVAGATSVVVVGLLLSMFGAKSASFGSERTGTTRRGRLGNVVTARPLVALILSAFVLLPLAYLAVGLRTVEPGPETFAKDASSRRTALLIANEFSSNDADAAFVLPSALVQTNRSEALARKFVDDVSNIGGVARIDTERGTVSQGREVPVPSGFSERYRSETATYMLVPLTANARGAAAEQVIVEIGSIDAPFRTNLGGATARQMDTVGAISGRALFSYAVGLAFVLVLVAGLLRSFRAGIRATLMALMMASITGAVLKYGFVDGVLDSILEFTANGAVSVVAGPIAWTLAGIIAASLVVIGWGAVRERVDASKGVAAVVGDGLRATAVDHVVAVAVLSLPLAGLLLSSWRTAQIPGAAATATALVGISIGRFVILPAFVAYRPHSLWPVQSDGEVRRVFPATTASVAWADHAAVPTQKKETISARIAPLQDESVVAEVTSADEPTDGELADAGERQEMDLVDTEVTVQDESGLLEETVSVSQADAAIVEPDAAAELSVGEIETEEPSVEEPVVVDVSGDGQSTLDDEETVAVEIIEPVALAPPAPIVPPVVGEVIDITDTKASSEETVAEADASGEGAVVEPDESGAADDDGAVAKSSDVPAVPLPVGADADADGRLEAGVEPTLAGPDLHVAGDAATAADLLGEEIPLPTVDVVSLTESVIASLEAEREFTTEIGSGFVANPSNNLSRVMEAILRDASTRGGEEVLVYGHASGGRYRWMVVDSGPRADNDPDRARTLVEAQRFIRRVGGVVECRPQGDFTVFVVEIPMAS